MDAIAGGGCQEEQFYTYLVVLLPKSRQVSYHYKLHSSIISNCYVFVPKNAILQEHSAV